MLVLLAVLFAVHPRVGAVHVFVEPGFEVLLDGRPVGISLASEGGLQIREVPVGDHEITVHQPTGGSATTRVSVNEGATASVSISSLGLRGRARGDDSTVEIEVSSATVSCDLMLGGQHFASASDQIRVEHVRPGRYHAVLTCGQQTATGDIEIFPGKIVTVNADFATKKMRVARDRARITSVVVPTAEDAIMRMPLPIRWKRAFVSSLVVGSKATTITKVSDYRAEANFSVPDYSLMYELVNKLKAHPDVQNVYVRDYNYSKNGTEVLLIVTFRNI